MKIINTLNPGREAPSRSEFIREYFSHFLIERDVMVLYQDVMAIDPSEKKAYYRNLAMTIRQYREAEAEQRPGTTKLLTSFPAFKLLPTELRTRIWDLATADYCQSRVHCIDELRSRLISNQPLSPLLYACHDSRNWYLHRTKNTFAFETCLNFERDIFYLTHLQEAEDLLPRFLECEPAKQIRTLAMPNHLYCHIPLISEDMRQAHRRMRMCMTGWKETLVVFEDDRDFNGVWADEHIRFTELSAREKRRRAERGYARKHCKVLNETPSEPALEPMLYRFVFAE